MKATNLLFWVQDNTLSEKFYKKLGFAVVRSDDEHTTVRLGDFELWLQTMRDEDEFAKDSLAAEKGRGMYVYIMVDDVDSMHKELEGRGINPTTQPRDWPWGNREFLVKDPDGYKLVFYTMLNWQIQLNVLQLCGN